VLSGTVECLLDTPEGRVRERLGPRDCIYFRSHLPHCLRSVGAAPARTLHVICSALGDTDVDRVDGELGPIFRHGAGDTARLLVARKIKLLRQRRGLSLGDCAAALHVSDRKLAAVEHGRRPVGLDLLLRACSTFRKPVEYFLDSVLIGPPYYVVQRGRRISRLRPRVRRQPFVRSRQRRYVFKSLADRFGARAMFPYYVRVASGGPTASKLHEHHGQEFVHVLAGEVTLITLVDGIRVTETLLRGDSCFIDSTVPHRFVATAGAYQMGDAEVIGVFWCPLGEDYLFVEPSARRGRRSK
jgi:transcriptional regulator with XRE-family HTH domain